MVELPSIESLLFPEGRNPDILVESYSDAARTVQVRGFTKHGTFYHDHVTNADRTLASTTFRLPELPFMVHAEPSVTGVVRGRLYVKLILRMGGFRVGRLSAAYLTDTKSITWPPGVFESSTEGPGFLRSITGTNPAAGVNIAETVPTSARWRLRAIRFSLTTDANVANREVQIRADDATTVLTSVPSRRNQTASQTAFYMAILGGPGNPFDGVQVGETMMPFADMLLFAGWRILTNVTNLQVGDDFAAPQLQIEEWIDP